MFITGLLGWWYGAGWRRRAGIVGERLARAADSFSIDLLIKTWFAPFRQISAGKVRGPLGVQIRAFFDRLISRMIGGIIRTFVILFGTVWLLVMSVLGIVELVLWFAVPLLPIAGAVLFAIGWVPSW